MLALPLPIFKVFDILSSRAKYLKNALIGLRRKLMKCICLRPPCLVRKHSLMYFFLSISLNIFSVFHSKIPVLSRYSLKTLPDLRCKVSSLTTRFGLAFSMKQGHQCLTLGASLDLELE